MKAYSIDGDTYFLTVEDAIDHHELEDGEHTLYPALSRPYDVADQPWHNIIADWVRENLYERLGEETAPDWCEQLDRKLVNNGDQLQAMIAATFRAWLAYNNLDHQMFEVVGAAEQSKIIVTGGAWDETN